MTKMMQHNEVKLDSDLERDYCVGTFRWKIEKKFTYMKGQPIPSYTPDQGWGRYLNDRSSSGFDAVKTAQNDLSMIDGLSFPLSIMYGMKKLDYWKLHRSNESEIHILVLGATFKAEMRIVNETNYWKELESMPFRGTIHIWLVGPEMKVSRTDGNSISKNVGSRIVVHSIIGTFKDWKTDPTVVSQQLYQSPATLCVAFNPGFGSGSADLMCSWCNDLLDIVDLNLPMLVTQANDYSDLRGEVAALRHIVHPQWILEPIRNPFGMALTTMSECGKNMWSSGNSYIYAIQGREKGLPKQLGPIDAAEFEAKCNKLASILRKTESSDNSDPQRREISINLNFTQKQLGKLRVLHLKQEQTVQQNSHQSLSDSHRSILIPAPTTTAIWELE